MVFKNYDLSLVGREKQIEEAHQMIRENENLRWTENPQKALFSIPVCAGIVGIGKTSLALEIGKTYVSTRKDVEVPQNLIFQKSKSKINYNFVLGPGIPN